MITIFRYLNSSFALLGSVPSSGPEIWEDLGRPKKVRVRSNNGGMWTIKPLWPWLNWLWQGQINHSDRNLGDDLKRVSSLLKHSLVAFSATLILFFYVIVISPPA